MLQTFSHEHCNLTTLCSLAALMTEVLSNVRRASPRSLKWDAANSVTNEWFVSHIVSAVFLPCPPCPMYIRLGHKRRYLTVDKVTLVPKGIFMMSLSFFCVEPDEDLKGVETAVMSRICCRCDQYFLCTTQNFDCRLIYRIDFWTFDSSETSRRLVEPAEIHSRTIILSLRCHHYSRTLFMILMVTNLTRLTIRMRELLLPIRQLLFPLITYHVIKWAAPPTPSPNINFSLADSIIIK